MTRDPAVAALLGPLEATYRRMGSRLRRAEFLSRRLTAPAPLPLAREAHPDQSAEDRQLRACVPEFSQR